MTSGRQPAKVPWFLVVFFVAIHHVPCSSKKYLRMIKAWFASFMLLHLASESFHFAHLAIYCSCFCFFRTGKPPCVSFMDLNYKSPIWINLPLSKDPWSKLHHLSLPPTLKCWSRQVSWWKQPKIIGFCTSHCLNVKKSIKKWKFWTFSQTSPRTK